MERGWKKGLERVRRSVEGKRYWGIKEEMGREEGNVERELGEAGREAEEGHDE